MKKLYLNIIWPGILIGLLHPFSGKMSSLPGAPDGRTAGSLESSSLAMDPSAGPSSETSESVCGELLFEPGNSKRIMQLPAFDPSRGRLTGIQITTEGTLLADIRRSKLSRNNFHALFSADLKAVFPGGLQLSQTATLNYQAPMSSDRQMETGIEALVDATTSETREITESLEGFYGAGNLDIPLEAANLINLKTENFKYQTQLKAKVCIEYFYDAN